MPFRKISLIFFLVISSVTIVTMGASELNENLAIFKDLIGKQWEGHFEDADEPMTLYMNWEPIIGGAAVQMRGWSTGSDMTRVNIYYWDNEKKQVAFLAMTSNGYVATGTAQLKDSVLTFLGRQIFPDGQVRETKSCWEFLPDGKVRASLYNHENGEWTPSHKIIYTPVDSKKG